jgi:hypothetical protein
MTITDESVDMAVEDDEFSAVEQEDQTPTRKKRDRDFSKFRPQHAELAEYVNLHSGLSPVTPQQVKAVLALRTDFNNTADQIAKREARKAALAADRTKYNGMTDEQIKAAKAADRVERQAAKLRKRLEEAVAKADAIRHGSEAGGTDLAAAVEAEQGGFDDDSAKRRFSRNR